MFKDEVGLNQDMVNTLNAIQNRADSEEVFMKWFDIIKQHPNNMARLLLFSTKLFGKLVNFTGNKSLIDTKIKLVIDHVPYIQPNIFKQFCSYLQGPAQCNFVTKVQTTLASLTNLPIASKFNEYYHPNGKRSPIVTGKRLKYSQIMSISHRNRKQNISVI